MRKDDAPAPGVSDQIRGPALPFHVDVFGPEGEGLAEDGAPHFFRSTEVSALRRGATGDDDRLTPAGEGGGGTRVSNRIEAKFYQVGVDDLVAPRTQLGRRVGRHGYAQFGRPHKITSSTGQNGTK